MLNIYVRVLEQQSIQHKPLEEYKEKHRLITPRHEGLAECKRRLVPSSIRLSLYADAYTQIIRKKNF